MKEVAVRHGRIDEQICEESRTPDGDREEHERARRLAEGTDKERRPTRD